MTPQDNSTPQAQTKKCKKCGILRTFSEFRPNRSGGIGVTCRHCTNERASRYYAKNRQRINERTKAYSAERRQKLKEDRKAKRLAYLKNVSEGALEITKTCIKCLLEKPLSEFSNSQVNRDGFSNYCKACTKGYHKNHYIEVWREKQKDTYYRNRDKNWLKRTINGCEIRSRKKGIPFGITGEDLIDPYTGLLPTHCPIFPHVELDYKSGGDRRRWASVDRIIPELGYVQGNVCIMSYGANLWKNNGSDPRELKIIKRIIAEARELKHGDSPGNQEQGSLFNI